MANLLTPFLRFDKSLGNPLKCRLTFLSLIGVMQMVQPQAEASAVAAKSAIVPTTFSITVPKFYPHEPPLIYTDRYTEIVKAGWS